MNVLNDSDVLKISNLVRDQFPEFYKQSGPGFIEFLEAYYEWMESPEGPIGKSKNLYKQFDIDTAAEQFLEHYKKKYMWGLPPELLGNQKLLQKHILELYRSKGSQQAIRLLFRLLFNEDIEFYIPSYDIFKLSDNTWVEPKYLEVTLSPVIEQYINQTITGSTSGATAIVESYESRSVNSIPTHLMFLSNISGEFLVDEAVLIDGIYIDDAPKILGSVVGVRINTSSDGVNIGDTYIAKSGEVPVKFSVSETQTSLGSLEFVIENPGSYYSMDAIITAMMPVHADRLLPVVNQNISDFTYAFTKTSNSNVNSYIRDSLYIDGIDIVVPDEVPLSGTGAQIEIASLANTFMIEHVLDPVKPYEFVDLDGTYPFPKNPDSNVATILDDSLMTTEIEVGSISSLRVINPGTGYSSNVYFKVTDPYTSTLGIKDENGDIVGKNAIIVGVPSIGSRIAKEVTVISSGYNNMIYNNLTFTSESNTNSTITGTPIVGGLGFDEGYYENTKSFLSDDKYLFDGHYYQDFSYVIKSSRTLDKYIDILKMLVHPAGNIVYGDIRIFKSNKLYNDAIITRMVRDDWIYKNPDQWNDDGIWIDHISYNQ